MAMPFPFYLSEAFSILSQQSFFHFISAKPFPFYLSKAFSILSQQSLYLGEAFFLPFYLFTFKTPDTTI